MFANALGSLIQNGVGSVAVWPDVESIHLLPEYVCSVVREFAEGR